MASVFRVASMMKPRGRAPARDDHKLSVGSGGIWSRIPVKPTSVPGMLEAAKVVRSITARDLLLPSDCCGMMYAKLPARSPLLLGNVIRIIGSSPQPLMDTRLRIWSPRV